MVIGIVVAEVGTDSLGCTLLFRDVFHVLKRVISATSCLQMSTQCILIPELVISSKAPPSWYPLRLPLEYLVIIDISDDEGSYTL